MLRRLIEENQALMAKLGEAQAKLKDLEDEAASKLIRPATMSETSNILLSQSGATKASMDDVLREARDK